MLNDESVTINPESNVEREKILTPREIIEGMDEFSNRTGRII